MTIAALLPVPTLGPAGERNFQRSLEALVSSGVDQVVLVEEPSPQKVRESVEALERDWIWYHHPQLLLPFGEVVKGISRCTYPALKTFSSFCRLDREESDAQSLSGKDAKRLGEALGKASFAVRRDLFLALGGLHPELFLDGDEGFEFAKRLRHFFPEVPTLELEGQWLFRAIAPGERPRREESRQRRKQAQALMEQDPESYLNSFPGFHEPSVQALVRDQALAPTHPHPPREVPKQLPGDFWGLTTFFNPEGYQSKLDNFHQFRAGLGLPLCVVELAFADREFELGPEDAEVLVQIRGGDILWQKERLLNLGLEHLPEGCDKVAWLDADVLFEQTAWALGTSALLERYQVVQPFSLSVRLRPGESSCSTDELPLGSAEHEVLHSIAYGVAAKGTESLGRYLAHGHSGYAWAARRELLEKHGFYEANILGNADLNIAQAMFGGKRFLKSDRLSSKALLHLQSWAERFYEDVQGSVAHLPGTLFHLWHGDKKDRLYHGRLEVLIEHDFDPGQDLAVGDSGALVWASNKPNLHQWCRNYFALRCEDKL